MELNRKKTFVVRKSINGMYVIRVRVANRPEIDKQGTPCIRYKRIGMSFQNWYSMGYPVQRKCEWSTKNLEYYYYCTRVSGRNSDYYWYTQSTEKIQ